MRPVAAMQWTLASAVFKGGTKEALLLKGRRVRARTRLLGMRVNDPSRPTPTTMDVSPGRIGILANAIGDELLLAYPKDQHAVVRTLEELMRRDFDAIWVNWPTFRAQFDIEI